MIFGQAFCPGPMAYKAFCSPQNSLLLGELCLLCTLCFHLRRLRSHLHLLNPFTQGGAEAVVQKRPLAFCFWRVQGEHCVSTTESKVPRAVMPTNRRRKGCTPWTSSASAVKSKGPLVSRTCKLHHIVLLLVTTKF